MSAGPLTRLRLVVLASLLSLPLDALCADPDDAPDTSVSPVTWDVTGTFRVRGHVFGAKGTKKQAWGGLYDGQNTPGSFLQQRLRLGVAAKYEDLASLNLHIQGLDDVVWGDNADLSSTALFAADPSTTDRTGLDQSPDLRLFRAWVETRLPIGLLRVGRQSSHWGMGLLASHGDGFDDAFGENRPRAFWFELVVVAVRLVHLLSLPCLCCRPPGYRKIHISICYRKIHIVG